MNESWDVIVVGGGAAGLMAAIHAASAGVRVLILEHMDRPGKKLLMTGNGKCNFTNEQLLKVNDWQDEQTCEDFYHGACPAFVLSALKQFDGTAALAFFEELGIVPIKKRGGFYPLGGQASGFLSVMLLECKRLGVSIQCDIGIRSIKKETDRFIFDTKSGFFYSRCCILATGGKSYKKTGSDGSGFLYVERFGHHLQDLVPALVPLQSDLAFFKKVAGIRAEITAKLYISGEENRCESGELQLTDYGISGICIFQLSDLASLALPSLVEVELDFAPSLSDAALQEFLCTRFSKPAACKKTAAECLLGFLPDRLGEALLEEAYLAPDMPAGGLSKRQLHSLSQKIKHFFVPITSTRSFEQAQVTAGGVDTGEVCSDTMESKLIDGLYFAGEMLDIHGICGGFNLQWAWSSGACAGSHAAAALRKEFI